MSGLELPESSVESSSPERAAVCGLSVSLPTEPLDESVDLPKEKLMQLCRSDRRSFS